MLKVGLTGGLASGKTHVARQLEDLGCHVIHADRIGHEALEPGSEGYEQVVAEFGREIVKAEGGIDRKALGVMVFSDPERLTTLTSLVHPYVFRRQEELFQQIAGQDPHGIVVVEAAIMIESGSYERYDRLILTVCLPKMQIERFRGRTGGTEQEARARLDRQMPIDEKRHYADYVIDTSGTFDETARQVRDVYEKLRQEAA